MEPRDQTGHFDLQITSTEFAQGQTIPAKYTSKGEDISPPLNIFNVPPGAQSLALIMHDPDAPAGDYTHWLLWDIPANTQTIAAGRVPIGAIQGMNSSEDTGYMGPAPPPGTGTHRYIFEIYALNDSLGLESGSNRAQLTQAMEDKIVDSASLTGIFSAES